MEVTVRELKATLSAVLRAVAAGQTATITSHKKPVARLLPPLPAVLPTTSAPTTTDSDVVEKLLAAGIISQRPVPWGVPPRQLIKLPPGVGSLSDAVIEDRR